MLGPKCPIDLENIIVIYIFISISQSHFSASFELCICDITTALWIQIRLWASKSWL